MVQTHFGPEQRDDCPMCGGRRSKSDDWDWAVSASVRPHYDPCDFPDHACSCGAAEDRPKIAAALAAARAGLPADAPEAAG